MLKEDEQKEKSRAGARKWYSKNREEYNALRRERYAKDAAARKKAKERAARYRAEKPAIEHELYRDLNGERKRVYSTGQVAVRMGRSPQMLRNWEKAELIPPSLFSDTHRLYTEAQLVMLIALENCIASVGGGWSAPRVKSLVREIHKNW